MWAFEAERPALACPPPLPGSWLAAVSLRKAVALKWEPLPLGVPDPPLLVLTLQLPPPAALSLSPRPLPSPITGTSHQTTSRSLLLLSFSSPQSLVMQGLSHFPEKTVAGERGPPCPIFLPAPRSPVSASTSLPSLRLGISPPRGGCSFSWTARTKAHARTHLQPTLCLSSPLAKRGAGVKSEVTNS